MSAKHEAPKTSLSAIEKLNADKNVEKEKKTCRLIQKLPTLYQGDQTSL
jgi:hypothetical protein